MTNYEHVAPHNAPDMKHGTAIKGCMLHQHSKFGVDWVARGSLGAVFCREKNTSPRCPCGRSGFHITLEALPRRGRATCESGCSAFKRVRQRENRPETREAVTPPPLLVVVQSWTCDVGEGGGATRDAGGETTVVGAWLNACSHAPMRGAESRDVK